jgi:hypothetical protein
LHQIEKLFVRKRSSSLFDGGAGWALGSWHGW